MTPEEQGASRQQLLGAYDTAAALVAKASTSEALVEAKRLRDERQVMIDDLNAALLEVGDSFVRRFAGMEAEVPAYDTEGDKFWLCFDGEHLLWFEARHGMRTWQPVRTCPLRIRMAVPTVLHTLLSALCARRWRRPKRPRNKFTNHSATEPERDT